jgi:hypothetical protein
MENLNNTTIDHLEQPKTFDGAPQRERPLEIKKPRNKSTL